MRILLVEDDRRIFAVMGSTLRRQGYQMEHASTAAAALVAAPCDLVLLDLGLPDGGGFAVCRALRERSAELGIIAVTERGEERGGIVGLRMGADDYVVKPFAIDEVQARIEAVLRRTARQGAQPCDVIDVAGLRIDLTARTVHVDARPVSLTRKEFDILASLARRPGFALTRERIILDVWQTTWSGRHTLAVHVAALRAKLGRPELIQTVRGHGYRLPVE
ncbi:response regulator transcription factor [Micromonospora sp. NPDC047557]|uniref:response regulator transcription factor n=1 Tax=Micromonospora sp. NPDC047557 TaxID=3364250 RepID=UPI00371C894B